MQQRLSEHLWNVVDFRPQQNSIQMSYDEVRNHGIDFSSCALLTHEIFRTCILYAPVGSHSSMMRFRYSRPTSAIVDQQLGHGK